jgi:predicted aspartyl protease
MSTFAHRVEIQNALTGEWVEFQSLVDTGAHFTQMPAPVLAQMGYEADTVTQFMDAGGSHVELSIGEIRMRIGNEARTVLAVFAEEDAPILLGATALENFRLMPDPIWHILRPIVAMRTTRIADARPSQTDLMLTMHPETEERE